MAFKYALCATLASWAVAVQSDARIHLNIEGDGSIRSVAPASGFNFLQLDQMRSRSQSQLLHTRSKSLSQRIQSYADSLENGPTREFLKTLHLCAPCHKYERFGEQNDGGYVMCSDDLDKNIVAAYSYGINGFDGWGMAIASRFHVPLNEYDCTNAQLPVLCAGCERHFHKQCILHNDGNPEYEAMLLRGVGDSRAADNEGNADTTAKVTGDSFKTLTQMLKDSGNAYAKDRSLLLKIDVESAEWKVFAEEPVENLKKFRQILVEYHWIHEVENHALYLKAVKKIEQAGFSVAHMHGNNYGGPMQHYGKYSIPDVIEVTYIQTPKEGCATDIPYHLNLDMSNNANPSWGEMPDAVLPASL